MPWRAVQRRAVPHVVLCGLYLVLCAVCCAPSVGTFNCAGLQCGCYRHVALALSVSPPTSTLTNPLFSGTQAALDLAASSFGGEVNSAVNCAGIGIAMRTVSKRGAHSLDAFRKVRSCSPSCPWLRECSLSGDQPHERRRLGSSACYLNSCKRAFRAT